MCNKLFQGAEAETFFYTLGGDIGDEGWTHGGE